MANSTDSVPALVARLKGKVPPSKLSRDELFRTHQGHLKKQASTPNVARAVKQPVPSEGYPASTKSIKELQRIPLSELQAETHHRGKGIIVKVVSPPFLGAGAVSIVEDEFGNVDKLAIYNHADSSILSGVPEGCIVAVKEPYYKFNGSETDFMICVDHPSDVILIRFTDSIIPEPLRVGPLLRSIEEWRSAGDKAFIERDFPTAVFCYTEALESVSPDDSSSATGLYAKRAGTNLFLGRYDAAKSDALRSKSDGSNEWRAYYTAGRAAYGLCEYQQCIGYLKQALELNSSAASVKKEYERCMARLREEETGSYDFKAMNASVTPQHVHLDHASFLRNTKVGESPLHGKGLFAARDLKAGDLILVEKAAFMPNQYEPARASPALYAMMVHQLYDNPSLASILLGLHPGDEFTRTGAEGSIVDGVPVVDVFMVEGIRNKNCFSAPPSTLNDTRPSVPGGRQAKGLWPHSSRMNHSCVANTMRSFVGDMLISRATRDIAAGDEIFQTYVPIKAVLALRQAQFTEGWGFACRCALCAAEAASPPERASRRNELLAAAERACNKRPPTGVVPDSAIRTVERLTRQLEDAHDAEVYAGMPRLSLIYATNWLIEAHQGRKNHAKAVRYSMKVLRNFGFAVPEDESEVWRPMDIYKVSDNHTLMTIYAVTALRSAAKGYAALGQAEMASQCEAAARKGYGMVTGFEEDVTILDT